MGSLGSGMSGKVWKSAAFLALTLAVSSESAIIALGMFVCWCAWLVVNHIDERHEQVMARLDKL